MTEEEKVVVEATNEQAAPAPEAPKEERHMGLRAKTILGNTIIYVILGLMSVIWLCPFIFIVLQSFNVYETQMVGYIIPKQWGFDNYVNLFQTTNYGRWLLNN